MTFAEFKTLVGTHLDVDATRRGAAAALRESATKAAMADLKRFIVCLQDGKTSYADTDQVPFDEAAAEAVAYFVKSRITRAVESDLTLASTFASDYVRMRTAIFRECSESRSRGRSVRAGATLPFVLEMKSDEEGIPWVSFAEYLITFTVKDTHGREVIRMTNEAGGGIEAGVTASWAISANDLCVGERYDYDIRIERVGASRVIPIEAGTITVTT